MAHSNIVTLGLFTNSPRNQINIKDLEKQLTVAVEISEEKSKESFMKTLQSNENTASSKKATQPSQGGIFNKVSNNGKIRPTLRVVQSK